MIKKILLLFFVFVCCLQLSIVAQQQQTRQVKGQVLTSTSLPPIRIKFDDQFKHIGTQQFILYERAQAEQHFFVDADKQRRIKRMYMIQFEGYLPSVDATYNYPATETVKLAGQTYMVNAESVPNVSDVLKQNPQSDAARAVSFLENKGYQMNPAVRFQRFVRLVDEAKRNELILIYIEDASDSSEKPGKEFLARALKGFTILE